MPPWALALLVSWGLALYWAPADAAMGERYRFIFMHVPFALATYLGTFLAAGAGALYLWRRDAEWDRWARALTEPAALAGGLTLWSGSLWGRITWGVWWVWDARLTSMLVLFLFLAGALVLRDLLGGGSRGARAGAVMAVAAAFLVPVVHLSVYWWRTLHQPPTVLRPQAPAMDGEMLGVWAVCVAAVGWWLLATAGARGKALAEAER